MKRLLATGVGVLLVVVALSAQGPSHPGPSFPGPLSITSNFWGGGPTLQVRNTDAAGDVAIDFWSGGGFAGNIGVIRAGEPVRFFVHQRAVDIPLTLAEEGGNVGVGTTNPQSALQVVGYTQLDLTSGTPPSTDCDASNERGRMVVDSAAGVLYVCVDVGWLAK